jgi:thiamine pyrophosphate-dependent acetolactate synthase large subunit-like protein
MADKDMRRLSDKLMIASVSNAEVDRKPSGIEFGPVDAVKYAEAFGARGFMIQSPGRITAVLKQAFDTPGPVVVGVHVDDRRQSQTL